MRGQIGKFQADVVEKTYVGVVVLFRAVSQEVMRGQMPSTFPKEEFDETH
jgi:hypothetical protein